VVERILRIQNLCTVLILSVLRLHGSMYDT